MDEVRRGKKLAADLDARGALWLGIAVHSSGLQEESRVPWSRVPLTLWLLQRRRCKLATKLGPHDRTTL